jgi:hypothetical protein
MRLGEMLSIDFIIDRSNLDIFETIWNNVDMSLFLDILNILDIFRYFQIFPKYLRYFKNISYLVSSLDICELFSL